MKTFRKQSETWLLTSYCLVVLIVTTLKIVWSNTRPIFFSGPDAETYILMSSDLLSKGFFSEELTSVPTWSQGYPTFLSLIRVVVGSGFEAVTQIIQVLLYALAVEMIRRLAETSFNFKRTSSSIIAIILTISPSGFFFPQQAMYETLLLFLFIALLFLLLPRDNNSTSIALLTSLVIAVLLVVHERSLLLVFLVLALYGRLQKRKFWISLLFASSIPALFIARNGIFYDSWRLQSGSSYVFDNIKSALMNNGRLVGSPYGEEASNFLVNMFNFWTSFSGYGKQGTWMHNATLDFVLDDFLPVNIIVLFSATISLSIFLLFARGALILKNSNPRLAFLVIALLYSATILSGFSYGDSRHRLIFSPILLLVCLQNFSFLTKKST